MPHKKRATVNLLILAVIASANLLGRKVDKFENKNLQILPKDISKEKLQQIMDGFNASLNVKCGYCHVRTADTNEWDYAADTKGHKKEARDMMRMTNELNEKYFGVDIKDLNAPAAINCYTCHRGEEHPVVDIPKPAINALDSLKRARPF
ncbi:MAG TPA: c-type cytochrome [Phnomibacter sp.]|nr:c-type cytochrome [Phnomibacter sp.]